jgi:serine/threonine-protein kinase
VEPESISPTPIGRFRVLRRLASGATTDVLLARAEGSDRVVALKVLLQQFRSDPAFEQMFVREAAAYARLSHPAIVQLYEFFAVDGQFVMVLEYVDGLPLHKLRAMLSIGGEKVEDSAALFIAARVFEALAAAHSARDPDTGALAPVIHRDINPSNVLVPWDANVKVSDFGIAKAGGTQADTKMGFVKGTYGYLAPEQVRGENITVRGDVYAASLLLWELLARRKAIQRGAMSETGVLQAMEHPDFPSLDVVRPDVDPSVRDAVRRGLAVNPDDRSITAEEMVVVLAGVMKADEGRATLAQAIARVRPAPGEPGTDSGGFKGALSIFDRAVNGSNPPAPVSPRSPVVAVAPAAVAESVKPAPVLVAKTDPPPLPSPETAPASPPPDPDPPIAGTEVPAPFPSATIPAPASSATIPAPAPAMSTAPPAVVATPTTATTPPTTVLPIVATPVVATPVVATPVVATPARAAATTPPTAPAVAVSAPHPVIVRPAPRRDLALVVVLLSALVGVAIVAFYLLWSEQGGTSSPPSALAPAASTSPAVPAQTAQSTQASPPAVRTAASASAAASSAASSAARPTASPSEASPSASTSPRVAKPAGSDPEAAAAGLGDIFTAASGGGHRVFLDGRVVGQSPDVIHVRCGRHEVRVGGNGVSQTVDIPCGGSLLVSPKWPAPDDSPGP